MPKNPKLDPTLDPFDKANSPRHRLMLLDKAIQEEGFKLSRYKEALEDAEDGYQEAYKAYMSHSTIMAQMETDFADGELSKQEFTAFQEQVEKLQADIQRLQRERHHRPIKIKAASANLSKLEHARRAIEFAMERDFVARHKKLALHELAPILGRVLGLASMESEGRFVDLELILKLEAERQGFTGINKIQELGREAVKKEFYEELHSED